MRLSLLEAAKHRPDHPAIITSTESVTYRALAARVTAEMDQLDGAPVALVATPDLPTIARIWACFEREIPVALLHPRLTDAERAPLEARVAGVPAETTAVFFTSGTTGTPKGARLSAAAMVASAEASAKNFGWAPDDRWLLAMPIAHVGGLSILVRCALARTTVLLQPRFSVPAVLRAVAEQRATLLSVVPTMLHRLLDAGMARADLRVVLVGGAPASAALLARASSLPVHTTYGLTEACSQVTLDGRPLAGTEVRLDAGRIQIRGPTMFQGYLGEPPHSGWFDTGDLGEWEDGRLVVHGRREDLILSGGENVYPAEVEAAILEAPGVARVCVFGRPDPEWGEIVAAAIVPEAAPLEAGALDSFLRDRLAGHKIPRRIHWVDELAENRSGKVDRRAVRAQLV